MILDNMKNCELYFGVNKKFQKAFDFIKTAVAENKPVGKYEIDGDELYASVQSYDSKLAENAKFEGHKRYIDIQYIIKGTEQMQVADISKMQTNTEYNETKDCVFYENSNEASVLIVGEGEYAIFFPHDIHRPGMSINETPMPVEKIVVKVKI